MPGPGTRTAGGDSMWHKYVGQHEEYAREKMIESYDIEAREREAKEQKSREAVEEVPGMPQNIPDFAPGCPQEPSEKK